MKKQRVDETLVKLGLVESRSKAQAFILAGEVYSRPSKNQSEDAWEPVLKSSQGFDEGQEFQIRSRSLQDVGRGALKLRGALATWTQIQPKGAKCLDIGASTGGFTQVLLENQAVSVVALDVGTNQLHERLRKDERVRSLEQQHVLKCDEAFWKSQSIVLPFDLIVTDLSFISLEKVIPHGASWLRPDGHWIVLLKPQFELDRSKLYKGIVKDESYRQEAIKKIQAVVKSTQANPAQALQWRACVPSPITGGDGNVEYLVWLQKVTS